MAKARAAVIIPYNDNLILIHRVKKDDEYYTIPGGGIEEGETPEEAAIREIKEEIGIDVVLSEKHYEFESFGRYQYFFVAKSFSGEIGTGTGDEMANPNFERYGSYEVSIVSLEQIKDIDLRPKEIKEIILKEENDA